MSKELANYNYCLEVIELKKNIELAFLTLGERLKEIRDRGLYENSWDSFGDYLQEIKMSESVASRLISVYTKMVLEYQLPSELIANAGGWSNAYEIIRVSSTKEEATKWLEDSAERLPRDTKIMLREAKTGISQDSCDHDWVQIRFCTKCNAKEKIYDQEQN